MHNVSIWQSKCLWNIFAWMTIFQVFSIVYIVEEDSHSTDLSVSGEEGDSTILLAHYSTGNKSQKVFFKTYQSKSTAVWLRKKNPREVFFASDKPENHTTERKRKKWKERGERKEENKKSCAYTLSFYVEFFEDSIWTRKKLFDGRDLFWL